MGTSVESPLLSLDSGCQRQQLHSIIVSACPGLPCIPQVLEGSWRFSDGQLGLLTVAPPHLGQVATTLPRLLAELHYILAQRVRCDGHLCQHLVTIAQEHGQDHLRWGQR